MGMSFCVLFGMSLFRSDKSTAYVPDRACVVGLMSPATKRPREITLSIAPRGMCFYDEFNLSTLSQGFSMPQCRQSAGTAQATHGCRSSAGPSRSCQSTSLGEPHLRLLRTSRVHILASTVSSRGHLSKSLRVMRNLTIASPTRNNFSVVLYSSFRPIKSGDEGGRLNQAHQDRRSAHGVV